MTPRFRKMARIYKLFADDYCDFSEKALQEMFEFESTGAHKDTICLTGFDRAKTLSVKSRCCRATVVQELTPEKIQRITTFYFKHGERALTDDECICLMNAGGLSEVSYWKCTECNQVSSNNDSVVEYPFPKPNGYAVGKKNLNITVAMWFERLGVTKKRESEELEDYTKRADKVYVERDGWFNVFCDLYYDGAFPHWWLNQIFGPFYLEKKLLCIEHGVEWIEPCEIFLLYFELNNGEFA